LFSLSQIRCAKNFGAYISANTAGVKLEPINIALILKKTALSLDLILFLIFHPCTAALNVEFNFQSFHYSDNFYYN